ncbi:MAG: hypothetical protein ACLTCI_09620 [[Clostridium] nexile]
MSKINTNAVKEQAINIMGDLKNLVSLYMENDRSGRNRGECHLVKRA